MVGNSDTATLLETPRTINGTSFDGSSNIITDSWGTSRNITIGNTSLSLDGSGDATWTLTDIGAAPADPAGYLPLSGGTLTDDMFCEAAISFKVSDTDAATQKVDARDDATNYARLYWQGTSNVGALSNFRHAWYDGSNYINVTALSGNVTFNSNITASSFIGDVVGNATSADHSTTSTNATNISVAANNAASDVQYPVFVSAATGDQRPNSDSSLTYVPSTNTLTAGVFAGNATSASKWASPINLTVGTTAKTIDGTIDVTWSLVDIGAAASVHTHDYLPLSGGTITGQLVANGSGESIYAEGNGNFNDVVIRSDSRLKSNLVEFDSPLDKVRSLFSGTFDKRQSLDSTDTTREAGLIAQEVKRVLPEAVSTDEQDILAISPSALIGLLVGAIKELSDKVESLEKDNQNLKGD